MNDTRLHSPINLAIKLLILSFGFASLLACAQTTISLDSQAMWLEPQGGSVGILTANGTVLKATGPTLAVLAEGFQGDSLVACNDQFLGVNALGKLTYVTSQTSSDFTVAVHHRPLCLKDGRVATLSSEANALVLLDAELNELTRIAVAALPDTEIQSADLNGDAQEDIVLLSAPSTRYQHGVLGDAIESITVTAFKDTLEPLATFTLSGPFVIEQRRVLPFNLGNKDGLLATRASARSGAGVILLNLEDDVLQISAEAPAIGTGFRWLNLFAAQDGFAYAVRTPHIGGAFQRYSLDGDTLDIEPFRLGVTNHVIGSRNLDLGVALPDNDQTHYFALPSQSLRSVELIHCTALCEVIDSFELENRLSTNLSYIKEAGQLFIVAADQSNNLYRWAFNP